MRQPPAKPMRLLILPTVAAFLLAPVTGVLAQTIEVNHGPELRQQEAFVGQPLRITPMVIGQSHARPVSTFTATPQTAGLLIAQMPEIMATAEQTTTTSQPVAAHMQDTVNPTSQLVAQPAIAHMPDIAGPNPPPPYIVVVR